MYKSLCKVEDSWWECSPYVRVGDVVVKSPDGILIPGFKGKPSFGVVTDATYGIHPDEERENEERILRIRSK